MASRPSRPIYETAKDQTAEREVAEIVATHRGLVAYAMPRLYPVDFALCRDREVERWLEVKCRTNRRDEYPTYMLGLGKWLGLMGLYGETLIPGLLAVRWTDCIGVLELPAPRMRVEIGGRKDRNDRQDVEPVVLIPIAQFILIHEELADNLTRGGESV